MNIQINKKGTAKFWINEHWWTCR